MEQIEDLVTPGTIGASNDEDDGETPSFAQIVLDRQETDPKGLFTIQAFSPQEHSQDTAIENVYVMVREMPANRSLNDYFDLSRSNFPKIYVGAVEEGIGQIVVNQQICAWVILTHVFDNTKWKTIRYYLRHEQRVFVIVCTSTPESFEKYHDTFQQITNSITFESAGP